MNALERMVENSTLTRLLASIFLFVIIMGATGIVGYDLIIGRDIEHWLIGVIGVAIGSSIKILGISAGIAFKKEDNA